MPINPNIALAYKGIEVENPLNRLAQFSQIQSAQNQNALAQYTLAAAQRGETVKSALDKAYLKSYNPQTGQIDLAALRGGVIEAGAGSELPAIEEKLAKVEKEQLARKEQLGKVIDQKLNQAKGLLANVDSNEKFMAWYDANNADPVLGEYFKSRGMNNEQARATLMSQLSQPGGLQRLVARSSTALDKLPELLQQEQTERILAGRTQSQPAVANAMAPIAPQPQQVSNAMVAQTAAVPAPAVTAMPATSGLQGELSAVNNEIARLVGSEAAGLPGVQARIKALEDQKAKLFTAITQEKQANTSALQAETSAKQANIASYKLTSTKNGVVKTNVLTGASEFVLGPDGKPITDISAAQAEETRRANLEQERIARFNAKLASDRQKLEQWKVDNPEKEIKEADGVFVAVDKRSGKATPITVGGKPLESGKPLNEAQGNSVAYGIRMKEANSIIEKLATEGTERSAVGAGAPYGIGGLVNAATASPQQQQFQQAKLNFITAILRKESGAAIGQDEFEREDQKYFPQIKDSDAVKAQKKQARETAIKAMEIQAGPGAKEIKNFEPRAEPSQPISAPKAGAVQDGYKFKGGDPSKPSSWEKL